MSWVIEGNAAGFAEFGRLCLDPSAASRVIDDACRELDRRAEMLERRRELRFRPPVSRRPAFAQHRAVGRTADALRRRRVQRRDFLYGRVLRSRVSPDGSLAAKTAAPCQHRVELLPGRDGRFRRRLSPAAVSLLQGGGSRQDERDGGTPSTRRATPQRARGNGARVSGHGRTATASAATLPGGGGGFSGSGKSTLALGLAPSVGAVPGAVVLRSDETRKRLAGVPLLQRLSPEGYSSLRVRARLLHLGRTGRPCPPFRPQRRRRCGLRARSRPGGH